MKYLFSFFVALCLLKVITFSLKVLVVFQDKEYKRFYEEEAYRKYLEHGYEYSILSSSINNNKSIPASFQLKDISSENESRSEVVFTRTWFQDYLRQIKEFVPSMNVADFEERTAQPSLLMNTVREEKAKEIIYSYFDKHRWFTNEHPDSKVKGMISGIADNEDEMAIQIAPYAYTITNEPFEKISNGRKTLPIPSNPFYYKGSLRNWSSVIYHPVTCESQTIHFE